MNRACLILAISCLLICGVEAQIHRDPPPFSVSINPTNIKFSSYDYMIGGYNSSPVQVIPDAQGGGVVMAFHSSDNLTNVVRYTNLAYVDNLGVLQSVDSILIDGAYNGYPSLDIDEVSGMGFLAWHNKIGNDTYYSVYGCLVSISGGQVNILGLPQPIFSPHVNGSDYEWPIVRFGPSPIAGMRRIYVMAKRMATGTSPREVPEIAYTDFHPDAATFEGDRFWTYLSIPELQTWANNANIWRRPYYTLVTGNNGSIYLCGYHTAYDVATDLDIIEPNLDVFISDNFCAGPWRRVTISAHQAPFCQPPFYDSLYADIASSGHFNAVMDSENKIHFPQLFVYSMTQAGNTYFYPYTHALRHVEFNTLTELFSIEDLYPLGASPHAPPPYTPWDLNEDEIVDEVDDNGYAVFPTNWPFLYWDSTAHQNSMFFNYNLQLVTEPNAQGWMACVWQDSDKARLYHQYPTIYPQYADYDNTPEIMISFSPDNGWTWLEPIVLNDVNTPQLDGMIPVWVYPANQIVILNHGDNTATGRLYLMFYDDNAWGSYFLQSPPSMNAGGNVMYMAIDVTLPFTHTTDPVNPPAVISLAQNYPNPFNNTTSIKFDLSKDSELALNIYNIKGQKVKTLAQGMTKSGCHSLDWYGDDESGKKVSSGLYFYKLQSGKKAITKKLLLLR